MTQEQYLKNLVVPAGRVDVVLDTDAFNEIDDQFAISYLLSSRDRLNIKGICAAPFLNRRVGSAAEGMEKSYVEIEKLLRLAGETALLDRVYRGSDRFLSDEVTPVRSDAAAFMAQLSRQYSPDQPLYIVALGAITNVASAILMEPQMRENCVIVWLGGHDIHFPMGASEFNMRQDIAAARVVMGSGVPFVQLPCMGVVSEVRLSHGEIEKWLLGKTALSDYLGMTAVNEAESYASGRPWTRIIWDVCAVAWLFNGEGRFMRSRNERILLPSYEGYYESEPLPYTMKYIYSINRDELMYDLIKKITEE